MAKDQKKRLKQKQKKAAKQKSKRVQHKKIERIKQQNTSEFILDKVDFALELAQDGNIIEASTIISKLKRKHFDNSDVQFGLGVLAIYSESTNEAIIHFDRAIEIDPTYIKAHFNRATAYQKLANVKCIVESLNNVIQLRHIDPELANQAQEKLDSLSEAISKEGGVDLNKFIEAQSAFETGFCYMERHEFETAIPYLEKAISINPDPPQTYGNLGLCYAYQGNKEMALDYLDKALELDPKYELALMNRTVIENLEPGEMLKAQEMKSTNYYVDYRNLR